MPLTLVLPDNFGYVALAVAGTYWLNLWQISRVGAARGRAKVAYPQAYAEVAQATASQDAFKFNCAQRAHNNTLEHVPAVISGLVLTGLKYPILASALGATWIIGRVLYTLGYITGDPAKRNTRGGSLHLIGALGLMLSSTWVAVEMIRGSY